MVPVMVNALKDEEASNVMFSMRTESLRQQKNQYEALWTQQQNSEKRLKDTMLTTIEASFKALNSPAVKATMASQSSRP